MGLLMTLPIKPIVRCSHLLNANPDKLKETKLRALKAGGKLHHCAADAWESMVAAALIDGIKLKPTSLGDLYRTYEGQLAGFKSRYVLTPIEGQSSRTFEGKKWYLRKGMAPMAAPGTSNHNLGIAVDVANANGVVLKWLEANALEFGFSWEILSEPWHLRYVAGDATPARVVKAV